MKYTLLALFTLLSLPVRNLAAGAEDAPRPEEKGSGVAADAKMKTVTIDCEAWQEGIPPEELYVVDGTMKIVTEDGSKVIKIEAEPIVDSPALVGDSAAGSASIQAKAKASKRGRSYPRFGVSVHGMSGHRLFVNCSKKQLELVRGEETIATSPCSWTTDTWCHLKLDATLTPEGKWSIDGRFWQQGETEPKEPNIHHEEPKEKIKGNGKVGIWGTPFSELPIYFDDIVVNVATK